MKADFYSLFCYLGAMLVSMFFAHLHEKKTSDKIFLVLSYLTTVCFCGFRFFVGNDYWGYYNLFWNLKQGLFPWYLICEPSFAGLNLLFIHSQIGYFYALFAATILTYFFIYKSLRDLNILKWGIFCIYTLCFLIIANDQVRQGIAISIFIFSIRYIDKGEFWKFLGMVAIATTFHYSAFVMVFAYFFRKVNFKPSIAFILLIVAFGVKVSGIAEDLLHTLASFASLYNESYGEKALNDRYFSGASFGVQLLYFFIVASIGVLFAGKKCNKVYYNIFVIGACLYMLCWGQMLFERMSLYFFQVIIVVMPHVLSKKSVVKFAVVSICTAYFMLQSLFALEKNGAVPYRTIYQENLVNPPYDKNTQVE